MASGAVKLLGATVDALYVSSRPAPIELTSSMVALGLFIGVAVSLASAAAPAREASLVSPVEAMARGEREYAARVHKMRDLWIALALRRCLEWWHRACPRSQASRSSAMPRPCCSSRPRPSPFLRMISGLTAISSNLLRRVAGVEAMLASRSLSSSLRRSAVLVGRALHRHRDDGFRRNHGGQLPPDRAKFGSTISSKPTSFCVLRATLLPTAIRPSTRHWPTPSPSFPVYPAWTAFAATKSAIRECPRP